MLIINILSVHRYLSSYGLILMIWVGDDETIIIWMKHLVTHIRAEIEHIKKI